MAKVTVEFVEGDETLATLGGHLQSIYESVGYSADFKAYLERAQKLKKEYKVEKVTDKAGDSYYRLLVRGWYNEVPPSPPHEGGNFYQEVLEGYRVFQRKDPNFKAFCERNADKIDIDLSHLSWC